MILDRLAEELAELAIVEQRPIQDGRNMTMMLGPSKAVLAGQFDDSKRGEVTQEALDGVADEVGQDEVAQGEVGQQEAEGGVDGATTTDAQETTPTDGDADGAEGISVNGGPATPVQAATAPAKPRRVAKAAPAMSEAMAALPPRRDRQAEDDSPALAQATPKSG